MSTEEDIVPPVVRGAVGVKVDEKLRLSMQGARNLLGQRGMSDVAGRAWARLTEPPTPPTVVLIGEVKRGKSSLVNSLVGRPGLSPVGVDITTSAYLKLVPDVAGSTEATLVFPSGRTVAIPAAEVADWISVDGKQVTDREVEELPLGAEVRVDAPFAHGAVLVDTPGLGGLNRAHAVLARTAHKAAGALLLVCDATAPISEPELEYLRAASDEVESVVIAVTKIDTNPVHWRTIVDEDRRLIAKHAPRFANAPVIGVSNLHAQRALQLPPGDERREKLLAASGIPLLGESIARLAVRADLVPVVNGLRTARTGIAGLVDATVRERDVVAAAGTGDDRGDDVERLRQLQATLQSGAWQDSLNQELRTLQRELGRSLDRHLDALKEDWFARIDETRLDVVRQSPQLFIAEITTDFQALLIRLSDEFADRVDTITGSRGMNPLTDIKPLHEVNIRAKDVRKDGLLDPMVMMFGGNAAGTAVAAAFAGGGWIALPFGAVAMAGVLAFKAIKRGRKALHDWTISTAATLRIEVSREIDAAVDELRPTLKHEYRRTLVASVTELKHLVEQAAKAKAATDAERADTIAELDARLAKLSACSSALDEQLERFAIQR